MGPTSTGSRGRGFDEGPRRSGANCQLSRAKKQKRGPHGQLSPRGPGPSRIPSAGVPSRRETVRLRQSVYRRFVFLFVFPLFFNSVLQTTWKRETGRNESIMTIESYDRRSRDLSSRFLSIICTLRTTVYYCRISMVSIESLLHEK